MDDPALPRARRLHLARDAAGAGRVVRVVAAGVGEDEELVAGDEFVVWPAGVAVGVVGLDDAAGAGAVAEVAGRRGSREREEVGFFWGVFFFRSMVLSVRCLDWVLRFARDEIPWELACGFSFGTVYVRRVREVLRPGGVR